MRQIGMLNEYGSFFDLDIRMSPIVWGNDWNGRISGHMIDLLAYKWTEWNYRQSDKLGYAKGCITPFKILNSKMWSSQS